MRIHHIVLAAGLMLAAASTSILAKDSSWTLRVHGAIIESSASDRTNEGNYAVSSVDVGGGFGIGAEYRVSNRFGLEFSTLFAGLEIGSSVSGGAKAVQSFELSMMPLTLAVPYHFRTGGRVDLGGRRIIKKVRYLDIETYADRAGVGTSVDVDSDAALGAALGVDVPFGNGKWAFSSGLRYMKTRAADTDVDPVIVTLGFAFRF
jgi:outer membrane protein W